MRIFNLPRLASLLALTLFASGCGGSASSGSSENSTAVRSDCGSEEAPIRIMPLGDSITESRAGHNSYRYPLYTQLIEHGCIADFVGSKRGVSSGSRDGPQLIPDAVFDYDHEGHGFYRTEEVFLKIKGTLAQSAPDIILIHTGSNDIFHSETVQNAISDIQDIISLARGVNPNVILLVAKVIPSTDDKPQLAALNEAIGSQLSGLSTAASPIIIVDQWSGFSEHADTYDGIHPNQSGEGKMAQRWFEALAGLFNL